MIRFEHTSPTDWNAGTARFEPYGSARPVGPPGKLLLSAVSLVSEGGRGAGGG